MKQWVPVQIPLAAGLDTKSDPRAKNAPLFDVLKDAEFEQPGGLQTRKPYATIGTNIHGGGALADIRRIIENGDELVCLTKESLYSYSPSLSAWVSRGTHLACKINEQTFFAGPGDQVDADRAELAGTIFYSWTESTGRVLVAAVDKSSGAVLLSPTNFGSSSNRARLVALTTKVLLVFADGGFLNCYALDPAAPGTSTNVTLMSSNVSSPAKYDIVRVGATDTAVMAVTRNPTTSYELMTITAALSVATATKARVSDGAIAVSVEPTGTSVQVCRSASGNVQGDLITISGFVDAFTAQAIGTTPGTPGVMTACHRSVQNSGVYRCYVFWEYGEVTSGAVDWYTQSNWVSTGNTLGTEAVFMPRWAPRARPFDREGRIFVWGAFIGRTDFHVGLTAAAGTALQSSYFLLRDDATLHAKAANCVAGAGAGAPASDGAGWIPGCQNIGADQYAFAGVICRVINIGPQQTSFAARSPQDITVTFDSNEARRTTRVGRTLYIPAGELLQYDGAKLTEVGFHHSPWYSLATTYASVAIAIGSYGYKPTWRATNARGEVERSSALCVGSVAYGAAAQAGAFDAIEALYLTHRTSVAWEMWRTAIDPQPEDPYFLITGRDPAATSNPNRFVFNVPSAGYLPSFHDEMTDAVASDNEVNPENGGFLEPVAPPACSIAVASADRVFLAGIAGDPHRVWYSKLRGDGEVAAFFDGNTVALPSYAGPITGLGLLNETLIAFTGTGIYALDGQGYNNLGEGQNYGPARLLSQDVGAVSHESIAFTPGGLVFKSAKGWYLLNRGWAVEYIGAPVTAYDAESIVAIHLVETQHQIRCLSSSRMLVFDYVVNQWAEWTVAGGVSAAMFGGVHHVATAADVKAQRSDYSGIDYGLEAKLAPIKLNDLQGAGSVRWLDILGELRGVCRLEVSLYRDYATASYQTETWTPSPGVVGEPLEVSVGPSIPKCIAIGVHIKALADGDGVWSEAVKLTGLALEVGIDKGINRRLPAAQKT